jgi:hypothetical protein
MDFVTQIIVVEIDDDHDSARIYFIQVQVHHWTRGATGIISFFESAVTMQKNPAEKWS